MSFSNDDIEKLRRVTNFETGLVLRQATEVERELALENESRERNRRFVKYFKNNRGNIVPLPRRDRRASYQLTTATILQFSRKLKRDESGAIAVMMAFLAIPLVGFLALGFEVSNWAMTTRAFQNAADAAVIAAATNHGPSYAVEARAVAATYGFIDGTNNIGVTPLQNFPCPDGKSSDCYRVTIAGFVPLLLSQVVGFKGNAVLDGAAQKQLSATAIAKPNIRADLCLLALGTGINGLSGNFNGCSSMSNASASCSGTLGIGISFAAGSNDGCGVQRLSQAALPDPYAALASNIPADPCNEFSAKQLGGPLSLSGGNNFLCGDQQLNSNVSVSTPLGQSAVLIIENGQLDLAGHSLTTSFGSALTLVFSGSSSPGIKHAPTDSTNGLTGTLDIAAPTTGPWAGVAIYQDPILTTGVAVSAAGLSPTWHITGLIYLPHASVNLNGAIDHATNGKACLVMVADNFQISNGGILKSDLGQCDQVGLKPPTITNARTSLVE